jgi:hypothetical protein
MTPIRFVVSFPIALIFFGGTIPIIWVITILATTSFREANFAVETAAKHWLRDIYG